MLTVITEIDKDVAATGPTEILEICGMATKVGLRQSEHVLLDELRQRKVSQLRFPCFLIGREEIIDGDDCYILPTPGLAITPWSFMDKTVRDFAFKCRTRVNLGGRLTIWIEENLSIRPNGLHKIEGLLKLRCRVVVARLIRAAREEDD